MVEELLELIERAVELVDDLCLRCVEVGEVRSDVLLGEDLFEGLFDFLDEIVDFSSDFACIVVNWLF